MTKLRPSNILIIWEKSLYLKKSILKWLFFLFKLKNDTHSPRPHPPKKIVSADMMTKSNSVARGQNIFTNMALEEKSLATPVLVHTHWGSFIMPIF